MQVMKSKCISYVRCKRYHRLDMRGAIHSTKISGWRFENFLVANWSRWARTVSFRFTRRTSFAYISFKLYNNPSYSRILIGPLLEDRYTIDVIIKKLFPLCFKMAESFENLDNILHDWAKDIKKSIVEALNRYKKHSLAGRRKIKPFLF